MEIFPASKFDFNKNISSSLEAHYQLGKIFQLTQLTKNYQLVPAFQLVYIMVKFGGAAPASWGGREAWSWQGPLGLVKANPS